MIWLQRGASDRDRFGRLLRYVFLEDGQMVNAVLVSEDLASSSLIWMPTMSRL